MRTDMVSIETYVNIKRVPAPFIPTAKTPDEKIGPLLKGLGETAAEVSDMQVLAELYLPSSTGKWA